MEKFKDLEQFKTVFSMEPIQQLKEMGGTSYIVGGSVRDAIIGRVPKDIDIVVCGVPHDILFSHLEKFGAISLVGESFGVLKFKPFGAIMDIDVALPRTDKKLPGEKGHKSILTQSDFNLSIEDDLLRRDFTINAMAVGEDMLLIDPTDGLFDLRNHLIRPVSDEVFLDDPLRLMRADSQAARFDFDLTEDLHDMIQHNAHLIKEITPERVLEEFEKVFDKGGNVKKFALLLKKTGLFKQFFGHEIRESCAEAKTLSDFLFLSIYPEVPSAEKFFTEKLKIGNSTKRELQALQLWFEGIPDEPPEWIAFKAQEKSKTVLKFMDKSMRKKFESKAFPNSFQDLALDGDDLMEMGIFGKEIASLQKRAVIAIMKGELENTVEGLTAFAKK